MKYIENRLKKLRDIVSVLGGGRTRAEKSYALNSGERQVAAELDSIRRDHRLRYELACELLSNAGVREGVIFDCFCGNGYGAKILSRVSKDILIIGLDASAGAIAQARTHYQSSQTWFMQDLFPFKLPIGKFEAVVSLESIEHIQDYRAFLSKLCDAIKPGGYILLSTPNQLTMPLERNNFEFHHKHFVPEEIKSLLLGSGVTLDKVWGQNCYVLNEGSVMSTLAPEGMDLIPDDRAAQFQLYFGHKARG